MAQKLLEEHPSKKIILSEIKSMKNLDLRKVEGKGQKVDTPVYIFVESSGDLTRSDARIKLSQRLMKKRIYSCLLYTSPSPRDLSTSRMPSSA